MSRRSLLRLPLLAAASAGAAASMAGCTSIRTVLQGRPTPDELLREGVAAAEAEIIAACSAALSAAKGKPALQSMLRDQLAHHRAHLLALGSEAGASPGASSGATAGASLSPRPAGSAGSGAPAVDPIKELRSLERAHSLSVTSATARAEDPRLARLLAQIAASEEQHLADWASFAKNAGTTREPSSNPGSNPGSDSGSNPGRQDYPIGTFDEALQASLAGEHAAAWAYAVAAVHLGVDDQFDALEAMAAHKLRRNEIRAELILRGQSPVGSAAAYRLPFEVADAASARRLLQLVEERVTMSLADLVSSAEAVAEDPSTSAAVSSTPGQNSSGQNSSGQNSSGQNSSGQSSGGWRPRATAWSADAAVSGLRWGARASAFPGAHPASQPSTMPSTSMSSGATASGSPSPGPS